ncbi:MAG: TolC family protein [Gemmataceae bacterium]
MRFGSIGPHLAFVCLVVVAGCVDRPVMPGANPAPFGAAEFFQDAGMPGNDSAPPPIPPPLPTSIKNVPKRIRYLSLNEALALALEQGYVGQTSARNPGSIVDDLSTFSGEIGSTDSVRVLALQPAIAGASIDAALSRFDPHSFLNLTFRGTDEPSTDLSANFNNSFNSSLNSSSNGQDATLNFGIAKPLSGGGVVGVSWITNYALLGSTSQDFGDTVNPYYLTRVQVGFEQPLLRDYGTRFNQLAGGFPSSSLFPGFSSRFGPGEGILLARLRHDQRQAEFERAVNHMLLNVETAYWNLYSAYVNLYATEHGLRMAMEVWRVAKEQFPERIDEGDFAGTRAQLQGFRTSRTQAMGRVIDAERTLRLFMGLPPDDGERLAPIDSPQIEPVEPNWHDSLHHAMTRRPELVIARQTLQRKQMQAELVLNKLMPDLRFVATHSTIGLGTRLDGSGKLADGIDAPANALKSLSNAQFNDWTLGVRFAMPLGFRAEHALVRQAKLEIAQAQGLIKEHEQKAQSFLAKQYSRLHELVEVIATRREQRQALAEQLEVRFRKFGAGKIQVDFLQDSVRQWAAALAAEHQAIAEYNSAIATFHFARGTLMAYDNVSILEGSVPSLGVVLASDHERQRSEDLGRKRRTAPPQGPMGLLRIGSQEAASVPQLLALEERPVFGSEESEAMVTVPLVVRSEATKGRVRIGIPSVGESEGKQR